MKLNPTGRLKTAGAAALACAATTLTASDVSTNSLAGTATNSVPAPAVEKSAGDQEQKWNVHVQNTDIVQGYPGFDARYSGPDSLPTGGETRETVSVDLMSGLRLWRGAEVHVDGLMWQGFGVNNSVGADGFPNGEAFRLGTNTPHWTISRLFFRQTIGLGGDQEDVDDDEFTLAGKQDISRITIQVGKMNPKDTFDNNAYANDPRTQFMNWAFMANQAWDFPADALGYITGMTVELNQPQWALRYGFFQEPNVSNGTDTDLHVLEAWGMVTELERRYTLHNHPGTVRLLAYLNHADMGSYQLAVDEYTPPQPANIVATRAYRFKYGFGLNVEQEIADNIGVFSRLGWSNGKTEAWAFSDVDYAASVGLSIKGAAWHRPDDTYGLAGAFNGISKSHQEYFEDGGVGILAGDGNLNYGWEKILETYYDFKVWKTAHFALDYQFIDDPAFNRDRGPVSFFGARLHWEF